MWYCELTDKTVWLTWGSVFGSGLVARNGATEQTVEPERRKREPKEKGKRKKNSRRRVNSTVRRL
jgi:hypothetical protein